MELSATLAPRRPHSRCWKTLFDLCEGKPQGDSVFQLTLFNTNMTTSHGRSSSGPSVSFFFFNPVFCSLNILLKHISIQIKTQRTLKSVSVDQTRMKNEPRKRYSASPGRTEKASETGKKKQYDQQHIVVFFSMAIMRE